MGLFTRRSSLFGRSRTLDRDPLVGRGGGYYAMLTPPSLPLFVISAVLAAGALLFRYAGVDVPVVTSANAFDILAIAYAILVAGVLLPRF
ncbi:hypothetical protein [Hansschlegelia zhihuaiae]|uniref:Uncharacterized protein n=1 Tax=Hansschlegelia zhihuaiae TaxID=405005 RepID=A0A4Q0MIZ5_9HYPH|nr:hypothetical protein [Hansschlegelia zhihuaiae]RXF73029.1 hypothetical protein EK403_12920 [Hansschlegelia zhihuaiae]